MNAYGQACSRVGQIEAHMEIIELLPYRANLTQEELDRQLSAARGVLRAASRLVEELEKVEVV